MRNEQSIKLLTSLNDENRFDYSTNLLFHILLMNCNWFFHSSYELTVQRYIFPCLIFLPKLMILFVKEIVSSEIWGKNYLGKTEWPACCLTGSSVETFPLATITYCAEQEAWLLTVCVWECHDERERERERGLGHWLGKFRGTRSELGRRTFSGTLYACFGD